MTIRPITTTRTIGINGAGSLSIDSAEIALLQAGFSMITIGRTNGSGTVTTSGANFIDPLTLLTPTGTLNINGKVATTSAAASIDIQAKTLNLNVDSAANDVLSTEAGAITITNANINLLADTKINTNTGTAGGDVSITATIDGAYDFVVDAFYDAAGGDVTFRGMPTTTTPFASIGGTIRPTSFTVNANNIDTQPHTNTNGSQVYNATGVITTRAGAHSASNGGDVTYNGVLNPLENLRIGATDVTFTGDVLNLNLTSQQLESTTTATSPIVALADTTGLFPGQKVSGTGIPAGTTITDVDIDGIHITLSAAATVSDTAYLVYGTMGSSTLTGSATVGTDTFTLTAGDTSGLYVGQPVFGTGVPTGATVTAINSPTSFTISANIATFSVLASITSSTLKATADSGTNAFTLTAGTTGSLSIGQALSGPYVQPGTVISLITGPTTFTTSLSTSPDALSPRVGVSPNSALTITATGETRFMGNVGVDSLGVAKPLNYVRIDKSALVTVDEAVRVLGAITITADEMNFNGGPDSIVGSTISLTASSVAINVILGTSPETGGSTELELSADDVDALSSGFALITIASPTTGGTLSVDGPVVFKSPTKLHSANLTSGTIYVNDTVTATGTASLEFYARTTDIGADITSAAGLITFTSLHQQLTGKVLVTDPATISSTSGSITFLASTSLAAPLTVSTATGDILTSGYILSSNLSDLTVSAATGDVTFLAPIGNGSAASRPGHVQVNNGGTTTFNAVDASSVATDAVGTTLLKGRVFSWAAAGIEFLDPLTIVNTLSIAANGTGGIDLWDTVDSNPVARTLTLRTVSGSINVHDNIGSVNPLLAFTISSTTGDVTVDGTVTATSVNFKGDAIDTNAVITTTGPQLYSGLADVDLAQLSAGTTLKVTSKQSITSTGAWAVTGRATLASTSTLATDGISVTGAGNSFGELHLTARNATVEEDGDILIAGGKISRVLTSAGITSLTSFNGSITQLGTFDTWHLIATASSPSATVNFSTGTLRVAELGAITADSDITIVRSAPGNLILKDTITSISGDVVIVADYASTANVDNDAGANPISAGGRYLLYAYDESLSLALLGGISAPTFAPLGIRYSNDPLAAGNPGNIGGTYLVFGHA